MQSVSQSVSQLFLMLPSEEGRASAVRNLAFTQICDCCEAIRLSLVAEPAPQYWYTAPQTVGLTGTVKSLPRRPSVQKEQLFLLIKTQNGQRLGR